MNSSRIRPWKQVLIGTLRLRLADGHDPHSCIPKQKPTIRKKPQPLALTALPTHVHVYGSAHPCTCICCLLCGLYYSAALSYVLTSGLHAMPCAAPQGARLHAMPCACAAPVRTRHTAAAIAPANDTTCTRERQEDTMGGRCNLHASNKQSTETTCTLPRRVGSTCAWVGNLFT